MLVERSSLARLRASVRSRVARADGERRSAASARRWLDDVFPRWRGERILDVGCGDGHVLVGLGRPHVGLDLRPGRYWPDLRGQTVVADAQWLPFREATFDGVVLESVLTYVPDDRRALAEARRVLRPRGRLAVRVAHRSVLRKAVGRPADPDHVRDYDLAALRALFESVGIRPVRWRTHYFYAPVAAMRLNQLASLVRLYRVPAVALDLLGRIVPPAFRGKLFLEGIVE